MFYELNKFQLWLFLCWNWIRGSFLEKPDNLETNAELQNEGMIEGQNEPMTRVRNKRFSE